MKTNLSVAVIRQYVANDFRKTVRWMSLHPIKSFIFACSFSLLGACLGVTLATECRGLFWPMVAIAVVLQWFYDFTIRRDNRKKLITALLAVFVFMVGFPTRAGEPPKDDPKPIGWGAAAVVVIVIGTVTYVYFRRFCQRYLNRPPAPPNTNAEPFRVIVPAALDDSFAATRTYYYWLSCDTTLGVIPPPVTAMELSGAFEQTTNGLELRTAPRKMDSGEDLVGVQEFEQILVGHGVRIDNGINVQSFGRNGKPSTQEEVPIYFWEEDGQQRVSVVGPGEPVSVVMERSQDLKHWETLLTVTVSTGQRIRFLDATTTSQMFYRFRPL